MVAEDGRLTINEKNRKRRGDKMRQEVTVGSKKIINSCVLSLFVSILPRGLVAHKTQGV